MEKEESNKPIMPPIETVELPELPRDILMNIFARLEIPDLVRASSVRPSWRSVYTSLLNLGKYKRSQTPCLLYTSESAGENVACLYSIAEKRVYKVTLPEPPICSRLLIGSSQGLLVTVDERSEMHIVNPITSEQVDLPSVITIEQVKPVYDDSGALRKYRYSRHTAKEVYSPPMIVELDELREMLHYKAFVFPNTTTGQYIVVLFHNPHRQLSFTRVRDDSWTWLPPRLHYEDCLYKDGLLYAVNYDGEIDVYDLSGPTVTMQIVLGMTDAITYSCMYIVQAPWGDLLQVWKSYKDYELHPEPGAFVFWNTGKFEIYEIDIERGERKKVKCLHDHALFLGHNQSLCISSVEYPALKRNHAYFTDDSYFWTRGFENNSRDIAILNLDNNIREELVSPQLWSDFPAPMWITLDVRAMDSALNK